ncbi:MAG: hypothetical protein AAF215_05485 [Cyanobacteria bacterium P01_A01_bin.123]
MTDLPTWLKPGVLAVSGSAIFAVSKVRKTKPPQTPSVHLVAANDTDYPLAQCRIATLTDLSNCTRYIGEDGTCWLLSLQGNIVTLARGEQIYRVKLPSEGMEFAQSVASFANAFDGEVVSDWEVPGE